MDFPLLALFLLNMVMILVDASVGYHMAPLIMEAIDDLEAGEAGVRTTRKLLLQLHGLFSGAHVVSADGMRVDRV